MSIQNIGYSPYVSFQQQAPSATLPAYTPTKPYPSDSVELSSKKSRNKKIAIGVGATLLAAAGAIFGVKAIKSNALKKAQKTFQEVFLRDDITKEQAAQMLQRYKDIGKIQDKEEYIKALFNEAKNNFGFEKGCLELKLFTSKEHPDSAGFVQKLEHYVNINKDRSKKEILDTMHHELRHKKQEFVMLNQCGTVEEFFPHTSMYAKDLSAKEIQEVAEYAIETHPKWLEQFGIDKLDKSHVRSKDKEYVEHLLKDLPTYKESEIVDGKINKEYYDNFLEVDARKSGKLIEKLLAKFF